MKEIEAPKKARLIAMRFRNQLNWSVGSSPIDSIPKDSPRAYDQEDRFDQNLWRSSSGTGDSSIPKETRTTKGKSEGESTKTQHWTWISYFEAHRPP